MPAHALDPIAYITLGISALLLTFGLAILLKSPGPGAAANWKRNCLLIFACLMVLLSLLSGGCAAVVLCSE